MSTGPGVGRLPVRSAIDDLCAASAASGAGRFQNFSKVRDCGDAVRRAAALKVESAVRAAAHTRERTTSIKTSESNGRSGGTDRAGELATATDKASICRRSARVKLLNTKDLPDSAIARPVQPATAAAGVGILRALAKVVVVGSTNTDMTVRVPRIPAPGETAGGRDFRVSGGGKGANQAVAAARAGATVEFLTAVGDDPLGEQALASLGAEGIDLGLAQRVPGPSGVALIVVDDAGENAIAVAAGANGELRPAHVSRSSIASPRATSFCCSSRSRWPQCSRQRRSRTRAATGGR